MILETVRVEIRFCAASMGALVGLLPALLARCLRCCFFGREGTLGLALPTFGNGDLLSHAALTPILRFHARSILAHD